MTPPTPTEVEELARELRLQAWYSDPHQFARWILTRFVRREERQHHFDLLLEDNARLRAELKGQRCDGSGTLVTSIGVLPRQTSLAICPSCPACKPAATPKGDEWEPCKLCGCPEGRCPGAEISCHGNPCFHIRDGGRTPESVSEAEHQASELGASRADSAAPVVHVVKPPMQLPNYICMYCLREEHPKPCQEFFEKTRRETVATSSTAPVNYCPECDGVLGEHVDWCSLAAPVPASALSDYDRGWLAGRDAAVAANVQSVERVVELGPTTLRALVAALLFGPGRDVTNPWVAHSRTLADKLLAELAHTEENR